MVQGHNARTGPDAFPKCVGARVSHGPGAQAYPHGYRLRSVGTAPLEYGLNLLNLKRQEQPYHGLIIIIKDIL